MSPPESGEAASARVRPAWLAAVAPAGRAGWLRCLWAAGAAFIAAYRLFPDGHGLAHQLPPYVAWGLLPAALLVAYANFEAFLVRWWHGLIYLAPTLYLLLVLIPNR